MTTLSPPVQRDNKTFTGNLFRNTIPTLLVLLAGISHGSYLYFYSNDEAVSMLRSDGIAFMLISSYAFMIALQIGITLLLWTILRLFRAKSGIMKTFSMVGYIVLPYALLSVLVNNYFSDLNSVFSDNRAVLISSILLLIAVIYFIFVKIIKVLEGFSNTKSMIGVAVLYVFIGSILYMFLF